MLQQQWKGTLAQGKCGIANVRSRHSLAAVLMNQWSKIALGGPGFSTESVTAICAVNMGLGMLTHFRYTSTEQDATAFLIILQGDGTDHLEVIICSAHPSPNGYSSSQCALMNDVAWHRSLWMKVSLVSSKAQKCHMRTSWYGCSPAANTFLQSGWGALGMISHLTFPLG